MTTTDVPCNCLCIDPGRYGPDPVPPTYEPFEDCALHGIGAPHTAFPTAGRTLHQCPNTPRCEHPALIHDVSGDDEDPVPICGAFGCPCGKTPEQQATEQASVDLLAGMVADVPR